MYHQPTMTCLPAPVRSSSRTQRGKPNYKVDDSEDDEEEESEDEESDDDQSEEESEEEGEVGEILIPNSKDTKVVDKILKSRVVVSEDKTESKEYLVKWKVFLVLHESYCFPTSHAKKKQGVVLSSRLLGASLSD